MSEQFESAEPVDTLPDQWLIYVQAHDAWGGLKLVNGQLVFEGENVAESARLFFESMRDVAQRFIDEAR